MTDNDFKREVRKQKRLEKLDSDNPLCGMCGENDWRTIEQHHIADYGRDETMVLLCRNCHRKVSDEQHDHPAFDKNADPMLDAMGHFLLGLADMLKIIVAKLYDFGLALIGRAQIEGVAP